jgi:transposase-like protein
MKNNNSLEKECFMNCPHCTSTTTKKQNQKTTLGYCTFRCSACKHLFNERTGTPFNFLEYPCAGYLAYPYHYLEKNRCRERYCQLSTIEMANRRKG